MTETTPTGQTPESAAAGRPEPWHPAALAAAAKAQARTRRGHLGEVLSVLIAEIGAVVLGRGLVAQGWRGAFALGLLMALVGIAAYFIGQALETAFRAWHTEPLAVRDALLAQLASRLPPPVRISYGCNAARTMPIPMSSGVTWSMLVFTDVSIVNMTDRPLILTFHLDSNVNRPDGKRTRARRAQVGNRDLIEKHVGPPRLHGPVDVAPLSSVVGNLGFVMGDEGQAAAALDGKPRLLIHDALTGFTGSVDPMRHQQCTFGDVDLARIGPPL